MRDFVAKILEANPRNKFVPSFLPVAEEIARLGVINSLTQTVLKFTVPGVPDIYQGNEIWDYSLVDPDNRRPVDYARRREMLRGLTNAAPPEFLQRWPDGRIKLLITQKLLRLRRDHAEFFQRANYVPLTFQGEFAQCGIGLVREHAGKAIVVIVPRLSSKLGFPPIGECWKDTAAIIPETLKAAILAEVFSREDWQISDRGLSIARAFSTLPFAVYTNLTR